MKKIPLTQGKFALVDDEDFEWLNQWKWKTDAKGTFYASRQINNKNIRVTIYMHRLIVDAPSGLKVDHINGDGLDNRRQNLRVVTHAQNLMNRGMQKNNKTGFKGVYQQLNRFISLIRFEGKPIYLGSFDTATEAAKTYNNKAKELFGEYAWLNDV